MADTSSESPNLSGVVLRKRNRLTAIMGCRCPKCRQGKMFPHSTYNLKKFGVMEGECTVCDQDFKIEPGFYFGASYFSYALNVGLIVTALVVFFAWFNEYSEWYLIGIIIALNVLLIPVNFRLSRSLMLHLTAGIKYKSILP